MITARRNGQVLLKPLVLLGVTAALTLLLLLTQGQPAHATTITVTTTADELNADGNCSLREAIQAANTDTAVDACPAGSGADTIVLPAGTYTLSIAGAGEDGNFTGDLDTLAALTINGDGAATTIIDGGRLDRVFHLIGGINAISGVTIRGGRSCFGGGVDIGPGVNVALSDSSVSDNRGWDPTLGDCGPVGDNGAGIYNEGNLTLDSSTVSGNSVSSNGGGIFNKSSGSVTLLSSTITGNTTAGGGTGGGIYNAGTMMLNTTTVSGNHAWKMGLGIYNDGSLTLNGSTVTANIRPYNDIDSDGAVFNSGTLTLNSSTVSGNSTGYGGGGIYDQHGSVTLNSSTVNGNSADNSGGGIYVYISGVVTINKSTISGNSVGYGGGGLFLFGGGSMTLNSSTVSGNSTAYYGGGLDGGPSGLGTFTLNSSTVNGNSTSYGGGAGIYRGTLITKNSIVANSPSDGNCLGVTITSLGHNMSSDSTCGFSAAGDLNGTDPMLGPLTNNGGPTQTHALLAGSPAIDAGSTDCPPPATDQRGVERPRDGDGNGSFVCDIGAFEALGPLAPTPTDTPTTPVPTAIASTCTAWNYTGNNLQVSRYGLRATTLLDGRVLVEGGSPTSSTFTTESELYDPVSNSWSVTGSLQQARREQTATLLPNGKVLVAGGYGSDEREAEVYDPTTGSWTLTGYMGQPRTRHSATLLPNGKVLVAGGWYGNMTATAELYDPSTGTWSPTGSMAMTRADHIAVLLPNGKVLVAGGAYTNGAQTNDAELYDPSTGTWSVTGSLNIARENFGAALLPNGKVLVMGGSTGPIIASAELYDPATGAWTQIAPMSTDRFIGPWAQPVSLPDGTVLVIGSDSAGTSEVFDPISAAWTSIVHMQEVRGGPATALLHDGRALAVAGSVGPGTSLTAEFCGPSSPPTPVSQASPTSTQPRVTPTATPPPALGGVALDPQLPGSSGSDAGLLAGVIAGAIASVFALGGGVWYARRRRVR